MPKAHLKVKDVTLRRAPRHEGPIDAVWVRKAPLLDGEG